MVPAVTVAQSFAVVILNSLKSLNPKITK